MHIFSVFWGFLLQVPEAFKVTHACITDCLCSLEVLNGTAAHLGCRNCKIVVEIQNHLLERQLSGWRGLPSILSFDINKVSLSYTEISSSVPESMGSRGRSLGTMF